MVSYYNFKSVDDFIFSQSAEQVWKETASVVRVFLAQISYTWKHYLNWQGTFFSEWLATSIMGIFSENAYYMSTWLSLGGFIVSESFLLMTIFRKILGADWYRSGIVTMSCIGMQVLLVPYPCEAFYWFCGSMVYTFIHGLAIILCSLWVLLYTLEANRAGKKGRISELLLKTGVLFYGIAVAGSNYITALTILILYVLCSVWYWWKKHPYRKWVSLCNIIYIVVFLVNVLAPGNRVRQGAAGVMQMGAMKSVLLSLKEAADYIVTWTIFPYVILGLLFLPLFWKMVQVKRFRYPWPVMVSLVSFGIFAAQFTPTLYALGIIGAGRVQNLYRLNMLLLLYGNELYWIGWCHRRFADCRQVQREERANQVSWLLAGWGIGMGVLVYGLSIWGGSTLTSVSAYQSLVRGEARQYYEENQKRLEILKDERIQDVELEPFTMKPYVLFFGDIVQDPEDWVNQHMADYYGKNSVRLKGN